MTRSLLHRIAASAAIILMIGAPISDVSGQRRGGDGAGSGGSASRSTSGGSVRQTRNTQSARTSPAAQGTQRETRTQTTGQETRQTTRAEVDRQAREIDTDQVGETTVIEGERGAIAVGEEGAVAVGEQGIAVADGGEINRGDWDGEDVIYRDDEDFRVYEDTEAWQVAAGIAAGVVVGTMLASPPAESTTVTVASTPYYYSDNAFYMPVMQGTEVVYEVVPAPVGAVIPTLPPDCTTRDISGVTHWICGESAYVQASGGYQVVAPPSP